MVSLDGLQVFIYIGFALWFFFRYVLILIHPYYIRPDSVVGFVGGQGSGKTLCAVRLAAAKYRRAYVRYTFRCIVVFIARRVFRRDWEYSETPRFFSNVPVEYRRGKFAEVLTREHLIMRRSLGGRGSVLLCDEVGAWFDSFSFDVKKNPDLRAARFLFRFIRHFTLNGYLITTEQSSDDISHILRRRMSKLYYLNGFRKFTVFGKGFGFTNIFSFVNSEEKVMFETHDKVEGNWWNKTATARRWFIFLFRYPKYPTHFFYPLRPHDDLEPVYWQGHKIADTPEYVPVDENGRIPSKYGALNGEGDPERVYYGGSG
jgi:hypothetical protein